MNLDLPKHAQDKVRRALEDVYQLTDDSDEKVRIAIFASGICIGQACGFMAASMGLATDQIDVVHDEILKLISVLVKKGVAEAWDHLTLDSPVMTDTEAKYAGQCVRGPWAGQMFVHYSKRKPVLIRNGAIVSEGAYEFMDSVWLWDGPSVPSQDRA